MYVLFFSNYTNAHGELWTKSAQAKLNRIPMHCDGRRAAILYLASSVHVPAFRQGCVWILCAVRVWSKESEARDPDVRNTGSNGPIFDTALVLDSKQKHDDG